MDNDTKFNKLEKAILEWFIENYKDLNLTTQIKSAKLVKREWTKVGFYITLKVPRNLKPIDFSIFTNREFVVSSFGVKKNDIKKGFPIYGPKIESDDIELGGDTLLWGENGYIDCIELVAFGSYFRENITSFKLK